MFAILRSLDIERYSPRCYVLAETDSTSATKAREFEEVAAAKAWAMYKMTKEGEEAGRFSEQQEFMIATVEAAVKGDKSKVSELTRLRRIPRSREVGQPFILVGRRCKLYPSLKSPCFHQPLDLRALTLLSST